MYKEVGASGQISLGKKYAGQLFDVIAHPDGRFELIPMRVIPAAKPPEPERVQSPDGWKPPGGYDSCTKWALDNREALEIYSRQVEQEGTAAEQLERFLAEHPAAAKDEHGPV